MALTNKTAFSKRAEQLKRYEDSETNRESIMPKNPSERKVRFSAGCIFLAACAAGDKDEVLNMLNNGGADIDTANVDGLTALHQVIINHFDCSHFSAARCVLEYFKFHFFFIGDVDS
jgi:protein phosphatase 1 regulatory subunit 12A